MFQRIFLSYQSCCNTKAAVTPWLSHGKASQWVLTCYKSLVNVIYKRKLDLINHKVIVSVLPCRHFKSTNVLQTILQGQGLTFWKYPMQLLILFKQYNRSLSIHMSQKENILVDYKSFLMLQYSLLGLVSTVSHTHHDLLRTPSKKKQFVLS